MKLRPAMTAALLTALVPGLAACGGSAHSSTSSASAAATSTRSSSSSSTTSAQSATSSSASLTTSTTRPPEVPRSRDRRRNFSPHPVAPASGVRIPASFTIQHGGPLTPAVISVPTGVTIEVQVRNLDSHGHSIRIDAPAAHTVSVPAGGGARVSVIGLANGSYRVLEDGRAEARIVVGSQPGP